MEHEDPLALDAETMRSIAHRTIDFLVDWLEDAEAPPLRRATPAEMRERLSGPAPETGRPFDELLEQLASDVLPYASRTGHPRFFAFIPGGGTWPGALADFIASACNVYAGSWMESAGPSQVELEVISWFKEWLGYPPEAAGTLVTGGSSANLAALACARESVGGEIPEELVLYVADQAHSSIARSARLLGMRREQVRVVPVGSAFTLGILEKLHKQAVYRDPRGELCTRSATCPHLGGIVAWNAAEKTWDCPLHGSRFDRCGKMINGPSNADLGTV